MRYPQSFIDDLRRQTDIVRIVGDYVPLKKKGKDWLACCPFHKEKTPSFSVVPGKEIYYCFGCHRGGSVFDFVMEIERVAFPDAIKLVAEKSGVALPVLEGDERFRASRKAADEVIQLNTWAVEWWEQQLSRNVGVMHYLEQRGIGRATSQEFRLGYAPDAWDELGSFLKGKGATQGQIERSGLVVRKDEGGSYDRFRGRLMIPVCDTRGKVIAFGGRALKPDDVKYINSPETAAYRKGLHLFGLHLSRDSIRRAGFAILVEGFLDMIALYQAGVLNVAASLGTALTVDQSKLLSRSAKKIVINYDGDKAGVNAAKKAIETLLVDDFEIKVLVLPDGADPDEFVRAHGLSEYQKHRGKAQPYIQFVIDQSVHGRDLHRPAEKAAAADEVLQTLRAVTSRIQKREYFDIAMEELHIQDPTLRRELWAAVQPDRNGRDVTKAVTKHGQVKPTGAEQQLLELLISDAKLRDVIVPSVTPDVYESLPTAGLFRALVELSGDGAVIDFGSMSAKTDGDAIAADLLPGLMMYESVADNDRDENFSAARRCLAALRLMTIDRRIDEIRHEVITAERNGETSRLDELVSEQLKLTRKRATMRARTEETR